MRLHQVLERHLIAPPRVGEQLFLEVSAGVDPIRVTPTSQGGCQRLTLAQPSSIVNRMVKSQALDRTFAALSDPTRRAMLERLSTGPASISELAKPAGISLPGVLKHVRILEEAELVTSEKKGRSRECRLGPAQLDDATAWIDWYRDRWNSRLDRLEAYIDKRKGGAR